MRAALAFAVTVILLGCAPVPQPDISSREPAINGQEQLLSKSELRAVLSVAQNRLVVLAPFCSIRRVTVLSPNKVEAHFCEHDDYLGLFRGTLTLERIQRRWKVTAERGGRPPKPEEVII
jgi:hypothetical protein